MMEAILSSETSVVTRVTRRNLPEDGILHSHCHEDLKSSKSWIVATAAGAVKGPNIVM
jgi:hypothetical protein